MTDPSNLGMALVREILSTGGLWHFTRVGEALGVESQRMPVRNVLESLEVDGVAVDVGMGYWKARDSVIDLSDMTHVTRRMATLLTMYACWPQPISIKEICDRHGWPRLHASGTCSHLREQGFILKTAYAVNVCSDAVAKGLESRLRPAPPRPALTELGVKVIRTLGDGDALTRVQIAGKLGLGRGSINRIVDRMIDEGRLVEVGSGLLVRG